jgi:hypothetical protein
MSNDIVPKSGGNPPPPNNPPSPAWFGQFLENQKTELSLKAQELELQKQKDANSFAYAEKALGAQERDRTHERECSRKTRKDLYFLVLGIVVIIAALVGVAMWLGKDQVALEIVKAVIYLLSGGAGGYGLGRAKTKNHASDPASNDA